MIIDDILFGDSYDPYIIRAYKGDTIIYEREKWDYTVYNHLFRGDDRTKHIYTGIQPFSSENIERDWEMIINANTIETTESSSTIGIISCTDTSTLIHYNLEIGIRPAGLYVYVRGKLSGPTDTVLSCSPIDKDVKLVKTNDDINLYVDDVLLASYSMTDTRASSDEICLGRWYGGRGSYYFSGFMNYFKFKFTS